MAALTVDESAYSVVRPARVYLVRCKFANPGGDADGRAESFMLDLALIRESALSLTVHMTVETAAGAPFALGVTYGADYQMSQEVPAGERDEVWRFTAYELAPALLYPYVREFFSDLTGRSLAPAATLPFLPIPLDVPLEDQEIPPPPSSPGPQNGPG